MSIFLFFRFSFRFRPSNVVAFDLSFSDIVARYALFALFAVGGEDADDARRVQGVGDAATSETAPSAVSIPSFLALFSLIMGISCFMTSTR